MSIPRIRPIQAAELRILKGFAPPDWNTDLSETFSFHFGHPYYYPIVAEQDGRIVGCGQGLLNGRTGWLGNIIVLPEYRGRGVGAALTQHLAERFRSLGCSSQLLIATRMGEPVYRKLGFEVTAQYVFLKREESCPPLEFPTVRRAGPADWAALFALDRTITGEDRRQFLERFLGDAWVHQPSGSAAIEGFYLPGLGTGPVLAANDQAGLALLSFKLGQGCQSVVIPEGNPAALVHLLENGFVEKTRAPRMVLGKELDWQPAKVYSRGAGYCG